MNNSSLLRWILDNSARLNINLKSYDYIKLALKDYFCYSAEIDYQGKTYYGCGVDSSESKAIIKAFVELMERFVGFYSNTPLSTSNGLAGHTDSSLARDNAMIELIERDTFLFQFFTRHKIETFDFYPYLSRFQNLKGYTEKRKLRFTAINYGVQSEVYVLGLITSVYGHGMTFCLGSGKSFDLALESLVTQCFSQIVLVDIECSTPIDINEFLAKSSYKPVDHLFVSLNTDYEEKFRDRVLGSNSTYKNKLTSDNIKVNEVLPNNSFVQRIVDETGLCFYKASSDFAQELFFGPNEIEYINIKKLQYSGFDLSFLDLSLPHPLA